MEANRKSAKELIKSALSELMQQKSYLDITVSDVVRKAGVARASFYRNYDSVNDVMDSIADDIANEISKAVLPVITGRDKGKWRNLLLKFFCDFPKSHFIAPPGHPENSGVLFSRMDTRIQTLESKLKGSDLDKKYLIFGKIGLITNITKRWINLGMQEAPDEMADYVLSFIMKF